jgi:hypothetical protein
VAVGSGWMRFWEEGRERIWEMNLEGSRTRCGMVAMFWLLREDVLERVFAGLGSS